MKKKVLCLLIILSVFLPSVVFAANMPTKIEGIVLKKPDKNNYSKLYGLKLNNKLGFDDSAWRTITNYYSSRQEQEYAYTTKKGIYEYETKCVTTNELYCVSPGLYDGTGNDKPYTCELVTRSDEYTRPTAYILDKSVSYSTYDQTVRAIALRMLKGKYGNPECGLANINKGTTDTMIYKCDAVLSVYAEYLTAYMEGRTFDYNNFASITDSGKKALQDAAALAVEAINNSTKLNVASESIYECTISGGNSSSYQRFVAKFTESEECTVIKSCTTDTTSNETVDDDIKGELNNCCEKSTDSSLSQAKVKELFADFECMDTPNYALKKNAAKYEVESDMNSAYCKLYCTERINVKQPSAMDIAANHYFKLNEVTYNGETFRSPVVDSYRSCRVKIRFDIWAQAYAEAIKTATTSYNDYQKTKREYEMYKSAGKSNTNITLSSQCTRGDLVSCGTYSLPANTKESTSGCTPQYTETWISKGSVAAEDGKCPSGSASTSYTLSGDNCLVKEKTKELAGYTCTDNTSANAIPSGLETSYSKTFNADKWSFPGTTYNYKKYAANISGNYLGTDLYKNVSIVTDTPGVIEHTLYSYKSTSGSSISQRISDLDTWRSNTASKMSGSNKCAHTSGYTYYNVTCTRNLGELDGKSYTEEDVQRKISEYETSKLNSSASAYANAVNVMEKLKKEIDYCDNYLATVDPKTYDPKPELNFYYEQAYLNEKGKNDLAQIRVSYVRKCRYNKVQVTNPSIYGDKASNVEKITNNVDELTDVIYSGNQVYGSNPINYRVYQCSTNGEDCTTESARKILDSATPDFKDVKVTPAFGYDGTFNTLCYWELEDSEEKFTVPGTGATVTSERVLGRDFNTGNQFLYTSKTTVLSGKYQTYANLTNLGRNGVFDKYIKENGQTCAKQASTATDKWASFTCTYNVHDFEASYGYCDSDEVTVDPSKCEQNGETYYAFKVVDTNNIFPTCSKLNTQVEKDNCFKQLNYGYNWLKTEEGAKALDNIQKANTFDQSNLTYSFKLDSNTMKAIKTYNKDQLSKGGYEDFELKCLDSCNVALSDISTSEFEYKYTIDGKPINAVYYDKACSRCYSSFIENLVNGKVGNTSINKNAWNRKDSLANVRNGLNW